MEPFKNIFNSKSIKEIALFIKKNYSSFDENNFQKHAKKNLNTLELKDRVRQISSSLKENLPQNYSKAIQILIGALAPEESHLDNEWDAKPTNGISGFLTWPIAHFIEDYGLDDLKTSFWAMTEVTKRFSSEFAIRPYLIHYPKESYKYLEGLLEDSNHHVRRWISEGTRPNLPWGMKVPNLDLDKNYQFLEKLIFDEHEYVRRSVANHLNDLSRVDKKNMLNFCKKFNKNPSKETQWVLRHASRTLLKAGDPEALKLHGYSPNLKSKLTQLKINKASIKLGSKVDLSFNLRNEMKREQKILIEYVIHFPKANGKLSPKAFRLKDTQLAAGETLKITKSLPFKKVTTRKHYYGDHFIELQVNGKTMGKKLKLHIQ